MSDEQLQKVKSAVLDHIKEVFNEMEEAIVMQHQERYSMLEDAFENSTDVSELRISFEQWHLEHADDLELEDGADDLWEAALAELDEDIDDGYSEDDDEEEDDEEEDDEDDDDEYESGY